MNTRIAWGLLLFLLTTSSYPIPPQFTAHYALSTGGMELGETRRTLRPDGPNTFVFESVTSPKGFLSLVINQQLHQRSRSEYREGRIRPLEYLRERTGGKEEDVTRIVFDWANHRAQATSDGKQRDFAIPDGTLDQLNFELALIQDLQQGKTHFTYPIADRKEVKTYDIQAVGQEQVDTPMGRFSTVRLKQLNPSGERDLTVWCAPRLNYLPVQIEYREKDGRLYRAKLRALEGWDSQQVSGLALVTRPQEVQTP
jgi:hypothetical protein